MQQNGSLLILNRRTRLIENNLIWEMNSKNTYTRNEAIIIIVNKFYKCRLYLRAIFQIIRPKKKHFYPSSNLKHTQ